MKAIITDRKTKQTSTFCNVVSAVTRFDYISIVYIDEDGHKESETFSYKGTEVKLLAE